MNSEIISMFIGFIIGFFGGIGGMIAIFFYLMRKISKLYRYTGTSKKW